MMIAKDIIKATNGKLIKGRPNTPIEDFSIDSRTLKKGALFVAIKGNKFDGHDFVEEAAKKDAIGAIISNSMIQDPGSKLLLIKVKDTTKALGNIAHYKRMRSKATVIAITGSNGKTTTKDMIASILARKFKVLSTKGTENNNIGLPLTVLKLKDEDFCVLEAGMNHFGEIDYLAEIARPDVGVITNINPCHLQHLGSIEDVFRAKTELLKYMDKGKTLIINGDDPYLSKIKKSSLRIIRFGLQKHNDVRATSITFKDGRTHFYVNERYSIQSNILGAHNIYNALAAVAIAELFDIKKAAIQNSFKGFKSLYSRLNLIEVNGIRIIDDTYNSNPSSLGYAIEVLAAHKARGKKFLVNGDMLELGGMSKYFHRAIVDMLEGSGIDVLITVGKYSHTTHLAARKKGIAKNNLWHFDRAEKAGRFLKDAAKEGDLVLVKGSRAMKMEEAINCFTTCSTP